MTAREALLVRVRGCVFACACARVLRRAHVRQRGEGGLLREGGATATRPPRANSSPALARPTPPSCHSPAAARPARSTCTPTTARPAATCTRATCRATSSRCGPWMVGRCPRHWRALRRCWMRCAPRARAAATRARPCLATARPPRQPQVRLGRARGAWRVLCGSCVFGARGEGPCRAAACAAQAAAKCTHTHIHARTCAPRSPHAQRPPAAQAPSPRRTPRPPKAHTLGASPCCLARCRPWGCLRAAAWSRSTRCRPCQVRARAWACVGGCGCVGVGGWVRACVRAGRAGEWWCACQHHPCRRRSAHVPTCPPRPCPDPAPAPAPAPGEPDEEFAARLAAATAAPPPFPITPPHPTARPPFGPLASGLHSRSVSASHEHTPSAPPGACGRGRAGVWACAGVAVCALQWCIEGAPA